MISIVTGPAAQAGTSSQKVRQATGTEFGAAPPGYTGSGGGENVEADGGDEREEEDAELVAMPAAEAYAAAR